MTSTLYDDPSAKTASAPTFVRLLNTEVRRLAARRFTRVLVALSILGYLAAMIFLWATHAKSTPEDVAQATAQRDSILQEWQQQCNNQSGQAADACGFVPTEETFPIDQFLANNPFQPDMVGMYALAVGAAVAMVGFVLGATSIGAEWSTKNLVAWLFYEPRRLRLIGAKLIVLCVTLVVLSFLAQAIWTLSGQLLLANRGEPVSSLRPERSLTFWSDTIAMQARAALLVLPAALLGFGLANLIRNTAAALGIAFAYFVIVENVVGAINPALQPYQFTISVAAWVSDGGITVAGDPVFNQELGYVMPEEISVSNVQGGLTLLIYALVVLALSVYLFRRRDIT
jgi:ABC-2 type transport system permease protein